MLYNRTYQMGIQCRGNFQICPDSWRPEPWFLSQSKKSLWTAYWLNPLILLTIACIGVSDPVTTVRQETSVNELNLEAEARA